MKRVLLTGATGFIGRHCIAPLLASSEWEVHAVSTRGDDGDEEKTPGVRWHRADLLNTEQTRRVVSDVEPTHLLHMAWYAVPGAYWTSLENFRWVRASLDLFEAFAEHGGERIVVAGTCAEYDWTGDGVCSEASTPLAPATLYGACKHALRVMLEAFARQKNLSAAWGRIFFLYGSHEHPDRLVASVIRSLLRGVPAPCSHGRQVRDFLHVADVAAAFVALLVSDVQGAVNIGSGSETAIKDVVLEIGDRLNGRELVQLGARPAPAGEPPRLVADVTRLRREVGWSPERDLREGLAETIVWWQREMENGEGGKG